MKNTARNLLIISITSIINAQPFSSEQVSDQSISFFSTRSQSTNAAREIVGWHPFIHRTCAPRSYTSWTLTPAYNHSARANRMAHVLFNTNPLIISGSQVLDRGREDILADYFGLSPTFLSQVFVNPKIQNVSLTFNGYVGFDSWFPGLYLTINAPVVWTQWQLDLDEFVKNDGLETPFPALYMDAGPVNAPIASFTRALQGGVTFGQMQDPLRFGKVCGTRSKHGLSDLQLALGYDIVNNYWGFAGFNLRVSAPTGSRPDSEFLFEPILGNGKHWEFGLGFIGRALMWEKEDNQQVSFWGIINFMHLFNACQRRSFDIGCRYLSRYMLVKAFDDAGNYTGELSPLINHTTLNCDVSVDIQVDVVAMLAYTHAGWVGDVGYEGWIRSKERIWIKDVFPANRFGLKGIQNVFTPGLVLSNVTQSTATIFGNEFSEQAVVADPNSPIFIQPDRINPQSAASPLLITHKFFAHLGYAWKDLWCGFITPFLGIGGEVEFEGINPRQRVVLHNDTMSQWGMWIKGGFSF